MKVPTLILITGVPGSGKTTLANALASELGASVLGHDWVMAGLKGFPEVWQQMQTLDSQEFRSVGWSVLWNLAMAELNNDRSVVLDGVARNLEVEGTRIIASRAQSHSFVVLCSLSDSKVHETRVTGRERGIPNWPELTWSDVVRTTTNFDSPDDVDFQVDSVHPLKFNVDQLRDALEQSDRAHLDFSE